MSTVGLGDFHPKQSSERILCALIMFVGVMITSLLMENFSAMIQEIKGFNSNYDESDRFNLFLGTMKTLNGETKLPKELEQSFESFFAYRWRFDKNLAVSEDVDFRLFEQLPVKVQTELYVHYLFKDFYIKYGKLLDLG